MGKNSFVLGSSWAKRMLDVPDDDFAVIVKAVFRFAVNGEHEQVTGLQKALVEEMTDFLEENAVKYEEVCEKRRLAGSIGGKQNAANAKQNVANGSKCYNLLCKSKQNVADNDNDNEYEKKKKMCSNEHMKEIADAWNATFANTDVPKVTILKPGSKRAKMLQARLDEFGKEKVIDAMKTAAESSFLTSSSWFSFDWFCCPSNFVKIIEGNYKDHAQQLPAFSQSPKRGSAAELQNFYDAAAKWAEGG